MEGFTYLGSIIYNKLSLNAKINRRLGKVSAAMFPKGSGLTVISLLAQLKDKFVGVDYFGPFLYKVRRCRVKRFIARRGVPEKVYSDNATNFHGAQEELKDAIQSHDVDAQSSKAPKRFHKQAEYLADIFLTRFLKEYLSL
ncbi:hypothetical protein CAPTEDRAFT_201173 [Capitella teleta]|uniref:Integrase catalytic domain-containing protein n=1 Tax=Capitella teleta TaxID=283909 RepID=R7V399_CAPTE|nr:hypothetical protein CAPTEDRAFT_201173 [Capitella teleta]|eukprot:ELU12962.1 hypothetical protein CAPTEDRAFT_201173 [Capitella teleta]